MALDPYIQVHGQVIIESFKDFSLMQVKPSILDHPAEYGVCVTGARRPLPAPSLVSTLSPSQAIHFNRSMPTEVMRANFYFLQKCAPFRLKGIWIIRKPYYMSFM